MRIHRVDCKTCTYKGIAVTLDTRNPHYCPSCGAIEIPYVTDIEFLCSSTDEHPLMDIISRIAAV